MTGEFWITTVAIVLGPLCAVLVTFYLQRRQDRTNRRLHVFRGLMTSRKNLLSPQRVEALNLVEIEFHGEQKVMEKFRLLLQVYNDGQKWTSEKPEIRERVQRDVEDKSAELINAVALALDYKFAELDLLRGGYNPEAYGNSDFQQNEIRNFLVGLSNGSASIPVSLEQSKKQMLPAPSIQSQLLPGQEEKKLKAKSD